MVITLLSLIIFATFSLLISRMNISICEIQRFLKDNSY